MYVWNSAHFLFIRLRTWGFLNSVCVCVFNAVQYVCYYRLTCRWSVSHVCPHPCGRCLSDCLPEPSDTEQTPCRWSDTFSLQQQGTGSALENTYTHTQRKLNWKLNTLCNIKWEINQRINALFDNQCSSVSFNGCSCWTRLRWDKFAVNDTAV